MVIFFIWSWILSILTDSFLIVRIKIGSRETLVPNMKYMYTKQHFLYSELNYFSLLLLDLAFACVISHIY